MRKARVDVARERHAQAQDRVRCGARSAWRDCEAGARPEEIQTARARVAAADAQIAVLEKAIADAAVIAPVAGIVTQKLVDAGRSSRSRHAARRHHRPRSRVGESLRPRADGAARDDRAGRDACSPMPADQGSQGKVTFISPRAEFTPRNVQTAEERSKLVYRIKVTVDNSAGVLKPGMPVDAELDSCQ